MAYKGKDGKEYVNLPKDYYDGTDIGADKTFLSEGSQAKIQEYKDQWAAANAAGDKAGMDAAHAAAEAIRESAGYQGGANGGAYNVLAKDEPMATGGGSGGSSRQEPFSYPSAPSYASKYQSKIDELTAQILNRAAFEYDPEKDPTYQQYKENYTRHGERAMQDTMGQMSARTGGLASSYAGSAAQQTYDNYMGALADKIPELKQLAYSMYMDEGNTQRANMEMLQALEQGDYNKYLTLLGQYNTDRSFDYGVYRDDRDFSHTLDRESVEDQRYNKEWNYQVGRDQIADSRYEDETAYNRDQDQYAKDMDRASALASTGDFSGYATIWDLSTEQTQKLVDDYARKKQLTDGQAARELADWYAQYGDFSKLKEQGVDTSYLSKVQNAELSNTTNKGGAGGGGKSGSTPSVGTVDTMLGFGSDAKAYEYLVGLDYSEAKTETLWNLYEAARDGGDGGDEDLTIENRHGYGKDGTVDWIYIPGHGRFSVQEVYNYVESGKVIETVDPKTGTVTYKWHTNKQE